MQRRLTIVAVNANMTVVSGYGARDLITELRSRPPMWSSRPRGWVIQPSTLPDLIALAEHRGFQVVHEDSGEAA
ncbi:hypothetical protein D0Z08_05875 [Nocardioides immobilis]|uniref:Uncharacterized protein n=1 Tax=Nocardioides immobilis TaxID=2049295 RepID=A0A417Y5E3_9ACTN|nr:hypothetical protein [Nocardioides immobilis]RHW27825.1 hypothetical protein D0Z08_05875 [Nocardioides immobilis]